MANISEVKGSYTFDFTNVKATDEEKISWIQNDLSKTIDGKKVVYSTTFHHLDDLNSNDPSLKNEQGVINNVELGFYGCGRWTYLNNVNFFAECEECRNSILKMEGLKITIDFIEFDFGAMFIREASCKVTVKDGQVIIEKLSQEDAELNEDNFCSYGFGDADDYASWR